MHDNSLINVLIFIDCSVFHRLKDGTLFFCGCSLRQIFQHFQGSKNQFKRALANCILALPMETSEGIFTLCSTSLTQDSRVGNGSGGGLGTKKGTQALISESQELGNQVTGFCVCGIKGH